MTAARRARKALASQTLLVDTTPPVTERVPRCQGPPTLNAEYRFPTSRQCFSGPLRAPNDDEKDLPGPLPTIGRPAHARAADRGSPLIGRWQVRRAAGCTLRCR